MKLLIHILSYVLLAVVSMVLCAIIIATWTHALDSFVAGDLDDKEMSQEWLGEIPVSHREITEDEYLKIFDKDNEYLKDWDKEQKLNMIHRIKSDE